MSNNICGGNCDICLQGAGSAEKPLNKNLHICVVGMSGSGQDSLLRQLVDANDSAAGASANNQRCRLKFSAISDESENVDIQVLTVRFPNSQAEYFHCYLL